MKSLNPHEILERAGADRFAPEGSQAWALSQVESLFLALVSVARDAREHLTRVRSGDIAEVEAMECAAQIDEILAIAGVSP